MADLPPGLQLVLEIIRDTSADRLCTSCRRPFGVPRVYLRDATDERILVAVECAHCQARVDVSVSPAASGGVASVT